MELHLHFHEGVQGIVQYERNGALQVQLTGECTRERMQQMHDALVRIEEALSTVKETGMAVSVQTQQLIDSVRRLEDAEDSALRLIDSIVARLRDNADDQQAIAGLATELESRREQIAAAVVANTPADPANAGTGTGGVDNTGVGSTETGSTEAGNSADPNNPDVGGSLAGG